MSLLCDNVRRLARASNNLVLSINALGAADVCTLKRHYVLAAMTHRVDWQGRCKQELLLAVAIAVAAVAVVAVVACSEILLSPAP